MALGKWLVGAAAAAIGLFLFKKAHAGGGGGGGAPGGGGVAGTPTIQLTQNTMYTLQAVGSASASQVESILTNLGFDFGVAGAAIPTQDPSSNPPGLWSAQAEFTGPDAVLAATQDVLTITLAFPIGAPS
jgi:hypothetical protein